MSSGETLRLYPAVSIVTLNLKSGVHGLAELEVTGLLCPGNPPGCTMARVLFTENAMLEKGSVRGEALQNF